MVFVAPQSLGFFLEKVVKFYSEDLQFRVAAVVSTDLVRSISETQDYSPLVNMALSRVVTAAALMASHTDEGQSLSLHFHGNGPLELLFAEASFTGECRAFCSNPLADLPLRDGQLDVQSAVGEGTLTVTRSVPDQKQPHSGTVAITGGGIGSDIAHYLDQSHQVPSAILLGTHLDENGGIEVAGGILVELLPGASESVIDHIEDRLQKAAPISQLLKSGLSAEQLVKKYLDFAKLVAVEHNHELQHVCKCSVDRVERSLTLLGKGELTSLRAKEEDLKVTCEFCGRRYVVRLERVDELLLAMGEQLKH